MEDKFAFIALNLIAFSCVVSATLLLLNDKDGWGWCLFIALVISLASVGVLQDEPVVEISITGESKGLSNERSD